MKKEIGSIFLTDPEFNIYFNNEKIKLLDLDNNIETIECDISNDKKVEIVKLESPKKTRTTQFHGVTWISGKKRIKNTAWKDILDGRIPKAKKYSFIVKADILKDELNDNNTDFKKNKKVETIVNTINKCIIESTHNILKDERSITKKQIATKHIKDIKQLSNLKKDYVGSFITKVQKKCPTIKEPDLEATTKIFIDMNKTKTGYDLLHRIAKLGPEELMI
ncbi:hypothetical protein MBCUT_08890 [Methanobrevibacter cuticularis]|uniref:Uncharacterized protein n=1 Tax=Methanobrevibacter cuticularis TaxID=47311 RepID=A0A166CRW8_9EURY|nr:hypothetical protein [Methanobrevibacter cuticularis]KZX16337.1 hypothetical protein MBCUT_08890 [Methanobrevibacter cuticularis]